MSKLSQAERVEAVEDDDAPSFFRMLAILMNQGLPFALALIGFFVLAAVEEKSRPTVLLSIVVLLLWRVCWHLTKLRTLLQNKTNPGGRK